MMRATLMVGSQGTMMTTFTLGIVIRPLLSKANSHPSSACFLVLSVLKQKSSGSSIFGRYHIVPHDSRKDVLQENCYFIVTALEHTALRMLVSFDPSPSHGSFVIFSASIARETVTMSYRKLQVLQGPMFSNRLSLRNSQQGNVFM